MIAFIAGFLVGGLVGALTLAWSVAGARADRLPPMDHPVRRPRTVDHVRHWVMTPDPGFTKTVELR